ncbi:branched-chain amino acid ABC transporter permease [Lachnotalea glycerini]|uniref:Branched-chain amino acid ABC transporter permease n=1 Tax=Lachnotalea glycerini TaxID=1763509 RepID=A0A371JKL4_9FIRM|nr:branched-chain amino acid ABC transporter permease [Lachnotalea glycerini]RDY33276.1 branched-chain amino acid ABC transporter permease [Lachnotalea glycerini]
MVIQCIFEGIVIGSILALIAMGIALIWGVMNVLSFSQGEFLMIGMYITFFLNKKWGIDPILSIPFTAILMFLIGLLIYKTLIRKALKGPILSQRLITFALSMVLVNGMLMLVTSEFRTIQKITFSGIIDFGFLVISKEKLVPLTVSILVTTVLFFFMNKTNTGKAIRATSLDKDAAELVGINTEFSYALAFGIASAIAGIAGCVLAYYYYITPTVGTSFLLFGLIAVALGGFGSIFGAYIGGILMGLVDVFAGVYFNTAFKYVAVCVLFMLVVSLRPKGLFGK